MASGPKELQRHGPTEGMKFTREQADKLFQRQLNKKISWFETVDSGLNNLIFFIQCENDSNKYVLKICGNVWTKIKTESEVNAINLVHQYTNIPIPKILDYSSNKNNEFGVEWIIMTRCLGKPLRSSTKIDDIWPELNIQEQKLIIDQLVQYIHQLHFNIPHTNLIGNYKNNGEIGPDSDGMGPWKNYLDFYNDRLKRQIKILNADPLFDPIRNEVLNSIKEFQTFQLPDFIDLPNVFTHNDLGVQNLIVSDKNQLNGIIDWEWSGSYPISEEYFRSYKPIIYNEQLKIYLYQQLENYQIPTPRTIQHFALLKNMNDLLQAIVPWYLTNLANREHPTVQKELISNKDKVIHLVQVIKQQLK